MRVLKWMLDRCAGKATAKETPIGFVPNAGDIDTTGLAPGEADIQGALKIDPAEWIEELESQKEWFDKLGKTMPQELVQMREKLLGEVKAAK